MEGRRKSAVRHVLIILMASAFPSRPTRHRAALTLITDSIGIEILS
jgi:hypothetical protein